MATVFLKLLNMSIAAGWLILAVIVLRLILKRVPKMFHCILWIIVGVRLVCPFSLESVLSLIPSAQTLPGEVITGQSFQIDTGVSLIDTQVNEYLGDTYYEGVTVAADKGKEWLQIMGIVWLAGMVCMLGYSIVSYGLLLGKVQTAIRMETVRQDIVQNHVDNRVHRVWVCDTIESPFILGLFRPRIYVPSRMDAKYLDYVLAHEYAHLKRGDHLWKPLGFLLLSVYWFHPFIWAAYLLLCRDIELACDEQVVKDMEISEKKEYSRALLCCSVPRHMIAACPVAFGEVGVKERIRSVLNYRKPTFWIMFAGVAVCVIVAVCFLTNPKKEVVPFTEENNLLGENIIEPDNGGQESPDARESESDDGILTAPPLMQVVYEDMSIEIASGNWQWSKRNADGTMTSDSASGAHPLENSYSDWGTYIFVEQSRELHPVELKFEVMPDSIEVTNYWPSSRIWFVEGNETGLQYNVMVDFVDYNWIAVRDDDSYVYEIKAIWDQEEYQGEATYSFQTRLRSLTIEKAVAAVPSEDIHEFQLVDGNTGEEKSYSMLDSSNGYRDLLKYYENLAFVDDDSLSDRIGYSYYMNICDVDGNVLQSVIAYKDAVQIDGKIYRCVDDSSTKLMLYMDLLFHPGDLGNAEERMHPMDELRPVEEDGTNGTDGIEVSMAFSRLDADGGTLAITNTSDKDLDFGEDYKLYVWKEETWQEYPVKDDKNYAFNAVAFMLDAGKTVEWDVNWSIMHGTLPEGRYKIEKNIDEMLEPGNFNRYNVSCQFVIKEA